MTNRILHELHNIEYKFNKNLTGLSESSLASFKIAKMKLCFLGLIGLKSKKNFNKLSSYFNNS